MKRNEHSDYKNDYGNFIQCKAVNPPEKLSLNITQDICRRLNPSTWLVFFKLAAIHVACGTISLLACPQFGLSLTHGPNLMAIFMPFGLIACSLFCGAFFVSLSFIAAGAILKPEEVIVLRKSRILQLALITTLSLGAFVCLGAQVIELMSAVWIAGSLLGAILSIEATWAIRKLAR